MNPISNLIGKSFSELTASELMQVISAYCDQNRYDYNYEYSPKSEKEAIQYFENTFYPIAVLKAFFKFWTK